MNRLKRAETLEEKEQVFDEWQDDILASGGKDALAEFFADWTAYEWVNARRPPVESIPMN